MILAGLILGLAPAVISTNGSTESFRRACAGASAGIGWAVCEALALAGLRVVAVARRRERLEQLQQTLVAAGVPIADFLPVVCDITKVRLQTLITVTSNQLQPQRRRCCDRI